MKIKQFKEYFLSELKLYQTDPEDSRRMSHQYTNDATEFYQTTTRVLEVTNEKLERYIGREITYYQDKTQKHSNISSIEFDGNHLMLLFDDAEVSMLIHRYEDLTSGKHKITVESKDLDPSEFANTMQGYGDNVFILDIIRDVYTHYYQIVDPHIDGSYIALS